MSQRQLAIDGLFYFKDFFRSENTKDYITSCLDHLTENNIKSMEDLSKLKYGFGFHEDPDSSDADDDDDVIDADDPCASSLLVTFAYACDGSGECCRPTANDATKKLVLKSFDVSREMGCKKMNSQLCLDVFGPDRHVNARMPGARLMYTFLKEAGLTTKKLTRNNVIAAALTAMVIRGKKLDFTPIEKENIGMMLFTFRREHFVGLLIEAGFQCLPPPQNVFEHWPQFMVEMERFYRKTWQPRSLTRLAANVVRKSLAPSALQGIKTLMSAPELPLPLDLATYVVFDFVDKRKFDDARQVLNGTDKIGLYSFEFMEEDL